MLANEKQGSSLLYDNNRVSLARLKTKSEYCALKVITDCFIRVSRALVIKVWSDPLLNMYLLFETLTLY